MAIKTAADITAELNAYTGDNIWQDVVLHLDDYDETRTEAADPGARSNVIVLIDGTEIRHDAQRGEWYEA